MVEMNNDAQVSQLRATIGKVVAIGSDFLAQKIPAEEMAETMVKVGTDYAKQVRENGDSAPRSNKSRELLEVLEEIIGCGSGFLEQRCDAACVARTITYLVQEFPESPAA